MATLLQPSLFSWEIVDRSPEILRLQRVLDVLPDGELLDALVAERAGKRNDYPIVAVWNSLIAGIVFGHDSVASLIRELRRNAELRLICGFDPLGGEEVVPNAWQYSKFFKKLFANAELVDAMFERLVERVRELLPDFGAHLAIDGKALPAYGRKDADADWGSKTYRGVKEDGTPYKKVKSWFDEVSRRLSPMQSCTSQNAISAKEVSAPSHAEDRPVQCKAGCRRCRLREPQRQVVGRMGRRQLLTIPPRARKERRRPTGTSVRFPGNGPENGECADPLAR